MTEFPAPVPSFQVGQRVRVQQYDVWPNPTWGNPHFIVGHFGHITRSDGPYFDVLISRGPSGPMDPRVTPDYPGEAVWPMLPDELEAVD